MKKWYLITGASSGIGYAVSKRMLAHSKELSCNLILIGGKNIEKLDKLLKDYETESFAVQMDFRQLAEIEDFFENDKRLKQMKLSGFIHCAGISPLQTIDQLDIMTLQETFSINYFSFMAIMKYFSRPEYSEDGARVLALSSIAVGSCGRRQSIYAASKAALENSIRYLAFGLVQRQITINGIALGCVETEMFQKLCEESHNLREYTYEQQRLGILPMDTVTNFIIDFLLVEEKGYMTGSIVEVNGGRFS
ncbi:MAG: SDR family oxidoreductase [Clostridiales bacterium]|nr:SDR family oxidoreductase [Clostridiales bacterium]